MTDLLCIWLPDSRPHESSLWLKHVIVPYQPISGSEVHDELWRTAKLLTYEVLRGSVGGPPLRFSRQEGRSEYMSEKSLRQLDEFEGSTKIEIYIDAEADPPLARFQFLADQLQCSFGRIEPSLEGWMDGALEVLIKYHATGRRCDGTALDEARGRAQVSIGFNGALSQLL